MRLNVALAGSLVAAITWTPACTARRAEPQQTLTVTVEHPVLESKAPLRVAVVWVQRSVSEQIELLFTYDKPYQARPRFPVRLHVPARADWTRLQHLDSVTLPPGRGFDDPPRGWALTGYRPRLVIYEDRDGDRRLDADTSPAEPFAPSGREDDDAGAEGHDWILAMDDYSLSPLALLDPKSAVAQLPLPAAERFYETTLGLSRFAFASQNGQLLAKAGSVHLARSMDQARSHAELACGRQTTSAISTSVVRARVDDALDPIAVCGLDTADCEPVDMEHLRVDWHPRQGSYPARFAQCKRGGQLEALIVVETATTCVSCSCQVQRSVTSYVVARDTEPSWWPCGSVLPYCDDDNLRDLTSGCDLVFSDAGADAGASDAAATDAAPSPGDASAIAERDADQ